MPELDDDVSKIHSTCPFCGGEYVVAQGAIRHSAPACDDFEHRSSGDFMRAAHEKEKARVVKNGART